MKLVIHGTSGGYRNISPYDKTLPDARPDSNDVNAIGQSAYALHFTIDDIIFTRYQIVRDVKATRKTGHIAFSAIIPHEKKLSGQDVITMLDKFALHYTSKYVQHDNLEINNLDLSFLNSLVEEFEPKLNKPNKERLQSGTSDSAFLYYADNAASENEKIFSLSKYFDAPYQGIYQPYKQVFFLNINLKDKRENTLALGALRHNPLADLTGKVDLNNPGYTIIINEKKQHSVSIEVYNTANNKNLNSNEKINKKDKLKIKWSKKHHEPKDWEFSINDAQYAEPCITVDHEKREITIDEKELNPVKYRFTFEVKYPDVTNKNGAQIICENSNGRKINGENNCVELTEEELNEKWYVHAIKDNLISKNIPLQQNNATNLLKLKLGEAGKQPCYLTPKKMIIYLVIVLLVIAIIGGIGIIFFGGSSDIHKPLSNSEKSQKIEKYLSDEYLSLDTLEDYRKKYCSNTSEKSDDNRNISIFDSFDVFNESDENFTSQLSNSCSNLDSAIYFRDALNNGKIDQVKKSKFLENNTNLKKAIDNIDEKYKKQVSDTLYAKTVSKMKLDDIADLINKVQEKLKSTETKKEVPKDDENKKGSTKNTKDSNKSSNNSGGKTDNTLSKDNSQSKSDALRKEFFQLVNSGITSKDSYDLLYNKYKNEKGEIKDYLKRICSNSREFNNFKNIAEKDRKTAKELTDIHF